MNRRQWLAAAALLLAAPVSAQALAQDAGDFAGFLETLRGAARDAGVSPAVFDSVAAGLTLDPSLTGKRAAQGEFVVPLKTYVDGAADPARVAKGRAMREKFSAPLAQIADRYGAPPEMILALWGMESDFGGSHGDRDILRSLATLAFLHRDNPVYGQEFVAGLVLLQRGVAREKLRGSWAGAMGDPQFMPSAYLKYARSFSGEGAPDIWNSGPDLLASIANFLKESGWRPGLPALIETRVPQNFDYASLQQDFSAFSQAGFVGVDGAPCRKAAPPCCFSRWARAGQPFCSAKISSC